MFLKKYFEKQKNKNEVKALLYTLTRDESLLLISSVTFYDNVMVFYPNRESLLQGINELKQKIQKRIDLWQKLPLVLKKSTANKNNNEYSEITVNFPFIGERQVPLLNLFNLKGTFQDLGTHQWTVLFEIPLNSVGHEFRYKYKFSASDFEHWVVLYMNFRALEDLLTRKICKDLSQFIMVFLEDYPRIYPRREYFLG